MIAFKSGDGELIRDRCVSVGESDVDVAVTKSVKISQGFQVLGG